jgi:hypothetical protein
MFGAITQVCPQFRIQLLYETLLTFLITGGSSGNSRSLLVLDSFRGHITDPVKQKFIDNKTDIAVIPGGCTSKLQPFDVSLNRPFKVKVRHLWANWMVENAHELTKGGRLKRPSYVEVANWVKQAWDEVPEATIMNSFKICGISNAPDGRDDDYIGMIDHQADEDGMTKEEQVLENLVLKWDDLEVDGNPSDYIDDSGYENKMQHL